MSNKAEFIESAQKLVRNQELSSQEQFDLVSYMAVLARENGPLQSVSDYTNTRNLGEFYDWLLAAPGISFSNAGLTVAPWLITVDYDFRKIGSGLVAGPDLGSSIYDMAFDSSANKLYIVGQFSEFEGITANCVIRYDTVYDTWESIGSPLSSTEESAIWCCELDSSGNLYVGGSFFDTYSRLAKWNGTSWSAVSGGANSSVNDIVIDGTTLYAGGAFTEVGSGPTAASKIAKLNLSTGTWSALGTGTSGGTNSVRCLAVDSSSNLWVGGTFTTAGGLASARAAKWNGSAWVALANGGLDGNVFACAVDSNDTVYFGGSFQNTDDSAKALTRVARYRNATWSALGSGVNNTVFGMAVDSYDKLLVTGSFTDPGDYAAEWDMSSWSEWGGGLENNTLGNPVDGTGITYAADLYNVYAYYQPYAYSINPLGYVAENQNNKTTTIGNPGGDILYPTEAAVRTYAPEKYEKSAAPGVGDDADDLYYVGDLWLDTTNDKIYECVDTTVGAAVWKEISKENVSELDDTTITTPADEDIMVYDTGSWVNKAFGKHFNFFNGSFLESFDALVTSDGVTVTMSLEKSGTGDLTMRFSDGFTTLDCTPAATIALTAGSDTSPQANYIYIPQSTKVLTKSTTGWDTNEHIKVSYFLVPSAAYVQSDGCYINQNWNDHSGLTSDSMGHMSHMAQRSRTLGAIYFSGIDANGIDQDTNSSYFHYVGVAESYFKSTAGVVYQMHRHSYPAKDTSGSDVMLVKNFSGTAYNEITQFNSITADSTGTSLSNKYFNLVIWGVANKSGEYGPVLVNLPSGSYNTQSGAEADSDGYDDFSIPREFSLDSSTGFLICRITLQYSGGTGTLEHVSTLDLRGRDPYTAAGGAAGTTTSFPDNTFNIYDESDNTKIIAFQASGITTGNTRTFTAPDSSGTIGLTPNDYTDIGAALADADLIIVDDGAAGTVRKSAISRLWTWIKTKTDLPLTAIDINGATDIGTNISDSEIIGLYYATGTQNRRSSMQRVYTYIRAKLDFDTDLPTTVLDIVGSADIGAALTDADVLIINDGGADNLQTKKTAMSRVWTYIDTKIKAMLDFPISAIDIDGGTDIGAALADADLIIVDDGAGGTNRKSAISRLWTWIKTKTDLPLTMLDIDGGTDIGAALVDADLLIVDDGAGGTNRKVEMSRVLTYIQQNNDGWEAKDETWTRASNTTFTISGDYSADPDYQPGTKIKFTQGTTKYGVIEQVSYGAPNTTVTIIETDDYIIVAGSSPTNPFVSHIETPDSYPGWFNWTPTIAANGSMTISNESISRAQWGVQGEKMHIIINVLCDTGGSANPTITATYPGNVVSATAATPAAGGARDASSGNTPVGTCVFNTSDIQFKKSDVSNWTLSTSRNIQINGTFDWTVA